MRNYVEREVFRYCSETCPDVDSVFDDLLKDIEDVIATRHFDEVKRRIGQSCEEVKKVGTYKLRDALREAVSDKHDIEADLETANRRILDLESNVYSLQSQLSDLEKELDEARA